MNARRVLVTAGAGGIGREMVRAFHAQGDRVFCCDVDAEGLQSLQRELSQVAGVPCDIGERASIERMMVSAYETLGGLDVLINNAGIAGPNAPVECVPPDEWERVLAVNLTGTFHVTRLAIPWLKQSTAGVIINLSSVAGRYGYANRSPYSVSKWGVVGFTKTLSIELGAFGIRANAILPGAVDGPRLQGVFAGRAQASGRTLDQVLDESMASQSIKRLVDPRDIAALAVFLASDAAKSISGQILPIDNDQYRA